MNNLNYGVIGNCRSAALISETGSIEWCCLPDFDSPSVFARLLDKNKGGYFGIRVDDSYSISQRYFHGTNILCTRFEAVEGIFEMIDFMPRYKTNNDRFYAPAEIYRYIHYISGAPSLAVEYFPALNYARETVTHEAEGTHIHIRTSSVQNPNDCIYLYSSLDIHDILLSNKVVIRSNQFMLLSYNQKLINIDISRVRLEYQRTKVYWLNWVNYSKKFDRYNEEINRSLLVLKIMSFQGSGAVLAALTTSLPETIGEVRNWDYRFCWLRDASMSIDTLLKMGHFSAAQGFLTYIKGILKSKHDTFQIMYGIRGERQLTEESLDHLAGYENSSPVRIGNAAYHQRQNDVFGYLLNVIYKYYKYFPGTLDEIEDMWEIVGNIVYTVSQNWQEPDKGIWEIRNDGKHFVFSKVMCWVAIDRATKIATLLNKARHATKWRVIANQIKEDVFANGWNSELNSFTQTYCNTDVDASLLLLAEYGFISASDPRYVGTVIAVKQQLFYKGLMYRYINADDFGLPSSSFTICTFWLIQAMHRIGLKDEAQSIFDNLLSYSNHVGLFSEDIDFDSKRLLGNFPQAYSHLALINTATMFSPEKFQSRFIKP